ncbi:hypothetical protein [Streptomyces sp. BE230]|uniref:hypothetical protein n=1 Tax=Streptomyces sp. BE230 TaxID=3002526 RepID=UPI002ED28C99|nr:hypothetical protein [Streptomyces sp. BE230]
MNATDAEITALLRQGNISNEGVARTLRVDKHRVGRIRIAAGLPPYQPQPLTLEEKWRSKTRPVEGGHLAWTGEQGTASRTPILRYKGECHTAAAVAFRLRTGRDPEGYAFAECGYFHCVEPTHVDDEPGRQLTREQLRYLSGGEQRPAQCVHGHDQAEHGKYESDGRAYCGECKAIQRTALRDQQLEPAGA